jgi:hypothetical protein
MSWAGWADAGKTRCTISHFVRNAGTNLRSAVLVFNNGDLENSVTIDRLTIRTFFGTVVHDSGPAVGILHPTNTDFPVAAPNGVDITVVPPGGNFYLRTNHIWGNSGLPTGNEQGQSMSAVVEFSKEGNPDLFVVEAFLRGRQRLQDASGTSIEGNELSVDGSHCFRVK